VDREGLDEAVEAAKAAYLAGLTRYTVIHGESESNLEWVENLKWKDAIAAAAPLIVKAERERIKAEVESEFNKVRIGPRPTMYEGQEALDAAHNRGATKMLDAVLALLDKEATDG
jgi:hypothetical protein